MPAITASFFSNSTVLTSTAKTPSAATTDHRPCRVCGAEGVRTRWDLGTAAPCSHYPESRGGSANRIPFRLGACRSCGVIQLQDSPPLDWLRPPRQCTLFRDPERHLDDLCAAMIGHMSRRDSLILGLSYKDAPLLDRLRAAGFPKTVVLDRVADWGLTNPRDGIETMQQRLTPQWARRICERYGPADVVCVRHVLEHAHEAPSFLAGCRALLAPGGRVLFETPGCTTELSRGDPGALWEEHVLYFTPDSLRRGLRRHGFACHWVGNYPYDVEDCLAAFGEFAEGTNVEERPTDAGEILLEEFDSARRQLRLCLEGWAKKMAEQGRSVALWGGGHRTATLVELLPAGDLVSCVIDDDPAKQGRYLPGSGIPILSADALSQHSVGLCVGLLNSDVLSRIAARHADYTARGGRLMTLTELCLTARNSPVGRTT